MKAIGSHGQLGQALLIAWALLALLPVANAIRVVREYAVEHILAEEWYSMAPIAIAVHDGTFRLSQLFEPVNEHPIVLSKLILALHTGLTNFSQVFGQHLNLLMSLLLLFGILWLLWRQDRTAMLLAVPFLSLSALNLRQSANWFIVFQNVFLLSSLAMLLIVLIFQCAPVGWRALLGAIAVAFVGSFSMGIAPALWLAPLPTLWLRGYRNWKYYIIWIFAATLVIILLVFSSSEAPKVFSFDQIGRLLFFALAFMGNGFVAALPSSLSSAAWIALLGFLLFALNASLLWRRQREWLASWLGIAAFGMLSSLLVGYGRLGFFSDELTRPLASRYVTHAVFFWHALFAIASINLTFWLRAARTRRKSLVSTTEPGIQGEQLTVGLQAKAAFANSRLSLAAGTPVSVVIVSVLLIIMQTDVQVLDFRRKHECILRLPATRDLDCASEVGMENSGDFLYVLPHADQLAVRRLGPFAEVPPIPVHDATVVISAKRLGLVTTNLKIDGQERIALLQRLPAEIAWETWFQHITVPTWFETAIYVPPPEFLTPELLAGNGVLFRIYTSAKWTNEKRLVFEGRYNPLVHSEPIPVRVDLAPYLNQRIILQTYFETIGDARLYERALWVEPRFVMELTEEAARAKYYPPQ